MIQYHKIQTVYLRSPESNYKNLMEGTWGTPEFEMLKDIKWIWTEKIDGTNIRVMWDGFNVTFGGKTDDAQMPPFLLKKLQETFTNEMMGAQFGFGIDSPAKEDEIRVCLYGEGYGARIQKGGGNYITGDVGFILFDCTVGDWWLNRESLEEIATNLSIQIVPIVGTGTLGEAVEYAKTGYKSTIAQNKETVAEGLIMKPAVDLFNRRGNRVVAKIKFRDFKTK